MQNGQEFTICAGCKGTEYTGNEEEDLAHHKLKLILELLRFEPWFHQKYLEEYPQKARQYARELISQEWEVKNLSTVKCTLCQSFPNMSTCTITYCGHVFHRECLFKHITKDGQWNQSHRSTCPVCDDAILMLHPI